MVGHHRLFAGMGGLGACSAFFYSVGMGMRFEVAATAGIFVCGVCEFAEHKGGWDIMGGSVDNAMLCMLPSTAVCFPVPQYVSQYRSFVALRVG